MRTEHEVLSQLQAWAEGNDLIRAAVLTSSRARPERETDFLSDYDVELYAADLAPFRRDDRWLNVFGPIMVRWPLKPRSTCREGWITRLVLFRDGVRIDFQISAQTAIAPDAYDDGCRVLIDKDDLTAGLSAPNFTEHLVKRPSREQYDTLVHEFWWDAAYVPKYLWRDELPFAASMLGQAVRDEYLRTVIEWFIGLRHGWSVNTGVRGRRFKRYLDAQTWAEFASTFARADIEENWQAFFNAVALFRRLARIVGEGLGYEYPAQLDREMSDYCARIRSMTPEGLISRHSDDAVALTPEEEESLNRADLRERVYALLHDRVGPQHRSLLRRLLAKEIEEARHPTDEAADALYWCGYLLSRIGNAEDALLLWEARSVNFDTRCGFDVQFLVGAGIEETVEFLEQRPEPEARAALEYVLHCRDAGDFEDLEGWRRRRHACFQG